MKKSNLELSQNNEKLVGGFIILNTEKLRKIKGGIDGNPNREICKNYTTRDCEVHNSLECTNYNHACANSVNTKYCASL